MAKMRNYLFFFTLGFFLSCNGSDIESDAASEQVYEPERIYGQVEGLPGRKILLYSLYGDEVILIDSVMAEAGGSFEFYFPPEREKGLYRLAMGKNTLPGLHDDHKQQLDLIWNGNTVVFQTHYASPLDSMEILISDENRLYYNFLRTMHDYERKISVLSNALVNYPQDDRFYRRLKRQYNRVQNRRSNYIDNLVKKNEGTVFSVIARFHKMPRISSPATGEGAGELRDQFFFENQFADPVILHTDLVPEKIIRYLSLYKISAGKDHEEQQEKFMSAIDVILQHAIENEEVFYFTLEYLINGFETMEDMGMVTEYLTSRYLLGDICFEEGTIAGSPAVGKPEPGDMVPEFSFSSPDGQMTGLYDVEAEYTLILFWGSWCPHCGDIMDELYGLYSELKEEQEGFFEVIAIGIEDDEQEWRDHIEKGGYDWINYSAFRRWDCPVARDYGLEGTPTMLLLDREKRLVEEPVRVRSLSRYLSRQIE